MGVPGVGCRWATRTRNTFSWPRSSFNLLLLVMQPMVLHWKTEYYALKDYPLQSCTVPIEMHTWTGKSAWLLSQRAWKKSQADKSTTHRLHQLKSATQWNWRLWGAVELCCCYPGWLLLLWLTPDRRDCWLIVVIWPRKFRSCGIKFLLRLFPSPDRTQLWATGMLTWFSQKDLQETLFKKVNGKSKTNYK